MEWIWNISKFHFLIKSWKKKQLDDENDILIFWDATIYLGSLWWNEWDKYDFVTKTFVKFGSVMSL